MQQLQTPCASHHPTLTFAHCPQCRAMYAAGLRNVVARTCVRQGQAACVDCLWLLLMVPCLAAGCSGGGMRVCHVLLLSNLLPA
jgi:hypothetical protein